MKICENCRELENTTKRSRFSLHAPVTLCPKHAAVDDLLAALKKNKETLTNIAMITDKLRDATSDAIAKAEPQP